MIKKILFLFVFAVAFCSLVSAQGNKSLLITKNSGEIQQVAIDLNSKITFEKKSMLVNNTNGETPFITTEIQSVKITDDSPILNGIENNHIGSELKIFYNTSDKNIYISGISTEIATAYIFNITGSLIMKKEISDNGRIDLNTLTRGIYIIKVEDNVTKFNKQ